MKRFWWQKSYKALKLLIFSGAFGILAGCYPGAKDFGYFYNPVQVPVLAAQAAKAGDLDTWRDLFTGRAYCVFANAKGLMAIKKLLDRKIKNLRDLEVDSLKLTSSFDQRTLLGISKIENYELEIVENNSSERIFEIDLKCTVGEKQAFCQISDLRSSLIKRLDQGNICQ